MNNNKSKLPLIITSSVVGAALVGTGIYAIVKHSKKDIEYPDVRAYFEERSEIISVTPVKDSENTMSEEDAVEELKERGFTTYPITSDYSVDGEFTDSVEVEDDSSTQHPIYRTYYMTAANELWSVALVDGVLTATPSLFNLQHPDKVPVEVSETGEIASYDLSTNSIYLTVPFDTAMDVRVVDRIDAATLESFDLEG